MSTTAPLPAAVRARATTAMRDLTNQRIHLIGIGGSGMAGLAAMLLKLGVPITGSDRAASTATMVLERRGVLISLIQDERSLPKDATWVVASAAIAASHPELAEARRRGLRVSKYAEMLGLIMSRLNGVAISGTHGKSTTTAWLAYTLRQAGLDPSFVVGAEVHQLGGGSGVGDGEHFIAEACEYDRSFLNLRPRSAAILNIEEDHLDCYRSIVDIRSAFAEFAALLPDDGRLVINGHDANCKIACELVKAPVETFGFSEECIWRAADLELSDGRYSYTAMYAANPLGRVQLGLAGRHNVMNSLAVIALARAAGADWTSIAKSLESFRGAARRLELRGQAGGVTVADDYAHHPTEIRATLSAARDRFSPRKVWCIFQPHQHSRTRFLLEDFATSFRAADRVVVPDIYFVRDSERERELVSSADLVRRIRDDGGDAVHISDFSDIVALLAREVSAGDLVLTMGAGDIWKVADELVGKLPGYQPA